MALGITALVGPILILLEASLGIGLIGLIGLTLTKRKPAGKRPSKTRISKRTRNILIIILGSLLVLLLVANTFFFGNIIGGITQKQLSKQGVKMTYNELSGSARTDVVCLQGLRLEASGWSC
jgi:hypothetical protein